MPTQNCYVVFKGQKPSIYNSWPKCQKQVNKFKGNAYQSYKSLLDAETTYNEDKQMHEKLPETSNTLESTKFIVETCEKGKYALVDLLSDLPLRPHANVAYLTIPLVANVAYLTIPSVHFLVLRTFTGNPSCLP